MLFLRFSSSYKLWRHCEFNGGVKMKNLYLTVLWTKKQVRLPVMWYLRTNWKSSLTKGLNADVIFVSCSAAIMISILSNNQWFNLFFCRGHYNWTGGLWSAGDVDKLNVEQPGCLLINVSSNICRCLLRESKSICSHSLRK